MPKTFENCALKLRAIAVGSFAYYLLEILFRCLLQPFGLVRKPRQKSVIPTFQETVRVREAAAAGAITFLWIAVEAALRVYFAKFGEPPMTGVTALSLLRRLDEDGTVTQVDYDTLAQGYQLRNKIVHGFDVHVTKSATERMFKAADFLIHRLMKAPPL
jgi:hypothetical protein